MHQESDAGEIFADFRAGSIPPRQERQSHLEKVCIALGYGMERNTQGVIQAARGLARAGDRGIEVAIREDAAVRCLCKSGLGQLAFLIKGAVRMLDPGKTDATSENGR